MGGSTDQAYPRCRFVITSRPEGYKSAPLERANVVEVQNFDWEKVKRFVKGWYLAEEAASVGTSPDFTKAGVQQRADRDAADLLRRLSDNKSAALQDLTVNPLLLTMIAMVHRYRGALPGKRIELYKEMCEVLLGRWRQSRGVEESLTADQKRLVLMPLAARMMERKIPEIHTDDALAIIKPLLRKVGVTGDTQKAFLGELRDSSGLLLDREEGVWSFAHLTFQEYLTAVYWVVEKCAPADWQPYVGDSWWHETLRLFTAQSDATPILQACLNANNVTALTLAAEITEEGALMMNEAVCAAVRERLESALTSPDPAARRLAAEVKLARRLSSFRRLDSRCEIDTTLITCAEYQLFIDDMRQTGSYHEPDHWVSFQHALEHATTPILGVMPTDVDAFCEWLNQRHGGKYVYRLPLTNEAASIAKQDLRYPFWIGSALRKQNDPKQNLHVPQGHSTSATDQSDAPCYGKSVEPEFMGWPVLPEDPTDPGLETNPSKYRTDSSREALVDSRNRLSSFIANQHITWQILAQPLNPNLPFAYSNTIYYEHTHISHLDHIRVQSLPFNFSRTRDRDLSFEVTRYSDLDLNLAQAHNLAELFEGALKTRALSENSDQGAEAASQLVGALSNNQLERSWQLATQLRDYPLSAQESSYLQLIMTRLALAQAIRENSFVNWRKAQRQYALYLLEYSWLEIQELRSSSIGLCRVRRWWDWLFRRSKQETDYAKQQAETAAAYWWLRIVAAREEGKLSAWEGVLLARERADDAE